MTVTVEARTALNDMANNSHLDTTASDVTVALYRAKGEAARRRMLLDYVQRTISYLEGDVVEGTSVPARLQALWSLEGYLRQDPASRGEAAIECLPGLDMFDLPADPAKLGIRLSKSNWGDLRAAWRSMWVNPLHMTGRFLWAKPLLNEDEGPSILIEEVTEVATLSV